MLPPAPVNVVLVPEHTVEAEALAVMVGDGLTVIVTVAVFVQPLLLVPVNVYVVIPVGLTLILAVVAPVLQPYELAPTPVKVVLVPEQIVDAEALAVTVGNGFTTSVDVDVFDPLEFVTFKLTV